MDIRKVRIGGTMLPQSSPRTKRHGSTTVLALMVSMLLIVLVMATMTLSVVEVELAEDSARNAKTKQASESGVAHGNIVLAHALSGFAMPASKDPDDIDTYANDAQGQNSPANLSLLVDTGTHFSEDIVDNGEYPDAQGTTEYTTGGLHVQYLSEINVTPTGVDLPPSSSIAYEHVFHYDYEISSQGQSNLGGQYNQASRVEEGSFEVDVRRPSFATYGYFTDSMKNQYDSQLVFFDGEIYGGPTHVNSAPPEGRCGFYGQATFNGPFTAVQGSYEESWLGGNADPIFNDTVTWGVDPVDPPTNGWSQLRASVGDYDNVGDQAPPAEGWEDWLIDWMELPPEATSLSQGVYYSPDYNQSSSLMGGVLVYGDATSISLETDGSDQFVTIAMNNSDGGEFDGAHTWAFRDTGTRTYVSFDGGEEVMYNEPLNGLIQVEGSIGALQGDGSTGADIQSEHEITVSATEDIYISDHLTYEVSPVDDPDATNILGIFSSAGNIWLAEDAPYNLDVHASVMASGAQKGVGAENLATGGGYDYSYPYKEDWNLLGGLIENKNQTTGVYYSDGHVTGYLWDFTYDGRFAEGKAPPYFPYVTKFLMQLQNLETTGWGRKYY
jgi:hypothetical protein